jgi:hypothetical protein
MTHLLSRVRHSPPSGAWVLTHRVWYRSSWGLALGLFVRPRACQLTWSCFTRQVEAQTAPYASRIFCASRCVLSGEMRRLSIPRRTNASFSRSLCARPYNPLRALAPLPLYLSLKSQAAIFILDRLADSVKPARNTSLCYATLRLSMTVRYLYHPRPVVRA